MVKRAFSETDHQNHSKTIVFFCFNILLKRPLQDKYSQDPSEADFLQDVRRKIDTLLPAASEIRKSQDSKMCVLPWKK